MSEQSTFRGILVLPKTQKLGSQTRKDLRNAGYVVLFLDDVNAYRVEDHTPLDVAGNAKVLIEEVLGANGSDTKSIILKKFGYKIAGLLK